MVLYSHHQGTLNNWRNLILHAANNPNFKSNFSPCLACNLSKGFADKHISELPEYKRNLIVFVMAKSGKGKAVDHWEKCKKLLSKIYKKKFICA